MFVLTVERQNSTRPTEHLPGLVHYQEQQIKEDQTQNHSKTKGLNVHSC